MSAGALVVSVDLAQRRLLRADATRAYVHTTARRTLYWTGRPLLIDGQSGRAPSGDELLRCLDDNAAMATLTGDFALVCVDLGAGAVLAAIAAGKPFFAEETVMLDPQTVSPVLEALARRVAGQQPAPPRAGETQS